ncbi:MAG: hypothetical protein LBP99_00615 [Azoarcus sp.]|jgi:hypothetical protein|nr:hypothetical protein [Azoarcus sp.]
MDMKSTHFRRFILLVVIFSSISLLTGCCRNQSCQTLWSQETGIASSTTQESIGSAYAKQAKELAPATGKLSVAIQAVVEYPPLSEGLSDEQILQYIYTEKPELGKIFSPRKVSFSRMDKYVEVTVYADDKTTVLVVDNSRTPEIDYIYSLSVSHD